MSAPLLSSLREPPVVGRYYMVPCVRWSWYGLVRDWPVNGPLHHDREGIGFAEVHYHIDGRFLTEREARLAFQVRWDGVVNNLNATPLANLRGRGPFAQGMPVQPTLVRKRCSRSTYGFDVPGHMTKSWGLPERYGAPAPAICRKDGRKLCPHRKVDLSQFPADANGLVKCPLHGLLVQVAPARSAEQ